MRTLSSILTLAGLVALVLVLPVGAQEQRAITVGLSLGYTGALGGTTTPISDGLLDHLMWINHEGGVGYKDPNMGKSDSVKMKIIWEDNAYSSTKSLGIYKRFKAADSKLVCVIGSTTGEAISASLSRDRIPGVGFYAGASPAGFRPEPLYYSTSSCTLTEEFCTNVKWFMSTWKGNRPPKIGGLSMDVPSWRSLGDPGGVKAYVEKAGAEWIGIEWLPMVVTDTSVQITKLTKEGADLIVIFGGTSHTMVVAKDMSRLGIDRKKVTVICGTPAWDESILKLIPKEGEGFYVGSPYAFAFEDVPGVRLAKQVRAWRGRVEQEMGAYLRGFVFGYVVKAGLQSALEKVGYSKITPTDIRDALFHLKNVDVGALLHELTVREPDYPEYVSHTRFARIEGGQFKIISPWMPMEQVKYGRK